MTLPQNDASGQNNTNPDSGQSEGGINATNNNSSETGTQEGNTPVGSGDNGNKADGESVKTDKAKPTDSEGKPKEGDVVPGAAEDKAPDTYAEFSIPEGINLEEQRLGDFTTLARELGLTQEKAQKLVDMASNLVTDNSKSNLEAWDKVRENWVKDIKEDSDFGGDKFKETIERAKRTLTKFGSEDFKNFLDVTGYGDNPHLIRLLAKIDKATAEDSFVEGTPSGELPKTAAQKIYPGYNKKE